MPIEKRNRDEEDSPNKERIKIANMTDPVMATSLDNFTMILKRFEGVLIKVEATVDNIDKRLKVVEETLAIHMSSNDWKLNEIRQELLSHSMEISGFLNMKQDEPQKLLAEIFRVAGVNHDPGSVKDCYAINYKDGIHAKLCVTFYNQKQKHDLMTAFKARRLAKKPIKLSDLTGLIIHDPKVFEEAKKLHLGTWNRLTPHTRNLLQIAKEKKNDLVDYVYEQDGHVMLKLAKSKKRMRINSPTELDRILSKERELDIRMETATE